MSKIKRDRTQKKSPIDEEEAYEKAIELAEQDGHEEDCLSEENIEEV